MTTGDRQPTTGDVPGRDEQGFWDGTFVEGVGAGDLSGDESVGSKNLPRAPAPSASPRICALHGGEEMFAPCIGGVGDSLGYCTRWDGTLLGHRQEVKPGIVKGGSPDCRWQ